MTKKANTTPTLVELKLAAITYFKGSEFEYLRNKMAEDACYSSHNSLQWKSEQMSQIKNDISAWRRENPDTEVIDVKIASKLRIYHKQEDELMLLQERYDADCEVYKTVTQGETYKPRPKRTHKSDGLGELRDIDALLAG